MDEDYEDAPMSHVEELFHHIYARANPSNPDMVKLVAVLDAVKQTIVETLGDGSDDAASNAPLTAYFAALMTALERSGLDHAKELFYLLSLVLPHIAPAILRSKYDALARLFSAALISPALLKDAPTLRSLLTCLGCVLAAAEPTSAAWSAPNVAQPFGALLAFSVDMRPKVRRVAHNSIIHIITTHYAAKESGASGALSSGLVRLLNASSQKDQAKVSQLLPLVRSTLPLLSSISHTTDVCDALLALPLMGIARITSMAFETICCLLESPKARLSIKFVQRLVKALLAVIPSPDNHVAAVEYSYAVTAGITRLANMERIKQGIPPEISLTFGHGKVNKGTDRPSLQAAVELLVPAIDALRSFFESARVAVHHACANSIAILIVSTIDENLIMRAASATRSVVHDLVASMEQILQYKYQPSWPVSLPAIALLFRVLGQHSATLMSGLTTAIVDLRSKLYEAVQAAQGAEEEEDDGKYRKKRVRKDKDDSDGSDVEVDTRNRNRVGAMGAVDVTGSVGRSGVYAAFRKCDVVIAAAIRSMGIHNFLQLIPLSTNPTVAISDDRAWLLPLLRDNGQYAPCSLAFFATLVMPAIKSLDTEAANLQAVRLPKNAKAMRTKAMQLWALLPNVMVCPDDFDAAFDVTFGQTLTRALNDTQHEELPAIVARAFETVLVRSREALGMPALSTSAFETADDEEDREGALTVAAGKMASHQQRKRADSSDDEEDGSDADEDDDDDEDGANSEVRAAGMPEMDGASTIFGAGGVSVHANGEESANPTHILLRNATATKEKLPVMGKDTAEKVLATLRKFAKHILPVFFSAYENCVTGKVSSESGVSLSANTVHERTRKLLDAVTVFLSIAPADVVAGLGERLLKLLVQTLGQQAAADAAVAEARKFSKSADKKSPAEVKAISEATQMASKLYSLLCLSQALIPSLPDSVEDGSPVARFFSALRPAINDDTHPRCQKRAYTVLAALLLNHPEFTAKSESRREEIVTLLRDSLMTVSAASRRGRLVCLRYVVQALNIKSREHMSLVPLLLGEVMLCTKDTNGKVRNAAFALLTAMAYRMAEGGDGPGGAAWAELEEDDTTAAAAVAPSDGFAVNLTEFFRMLLGGFAASTPHMRSAAVRATARLMYEFAGREVVHSLLEPMLYAALELLKEKSREVALAVVGFVKVCLSCMPPNDLANHIEAIITALMVWSGVTKNRIRAKIKIVIGRLVRKFGYEAVEAYVPATDIKLLQHMKKQQARRERKRMQRDMDAEGGAGGEGATTITRARTAFDDLLDDDDDDLSGSDVGSADGKSRFTAASAKSWGVVGTRLGSTAGKMQSSRMSAVTADVRKQFKGLADAPLPPVGSIIELQGNNNNKSKKGAKTVLSTGKSAVTATAAGGKPRKAEAFESMLKADDDTPIDLLDTKAMRAVVGADPLTLAAITRQRKMVSAAAGTDLGAGVRIAKDGRIVISEDADGSDTSSDSEEDKDARDIRMKKHVRDRRGKEDKDEADKDDADAAGKRKKAVASGDLPVAAQGWGMKKGKGNAGKSGKTSNFTGAQYKSKHAGGDTQKKGAKFEPFAYVPLDAKAMPGAGSDRASGRFGTVMESTSKAARSAAKRHEDKTVLGKRPRR